MISLLHLVIINHKEKGSKRNLNPKEGVDSELVMLGFDQEGKELILGFCCSF